MSREERQALLHEGSGSAVMSAYVEIIFDNSDERFPTGNKEVILRRTIGLKKDEYSVDKKVVTKNDVMNLLEAAGFSRSNPYYIVPQGRVTALTNMKESDRLNLLKEVAGTQVYEARRAESLKIMHETNNKREKIDELLEYIKERLSELEEEKEELRGFQDKDRERRCLEYAFYHQEQVTIQEALEEIESTRQEGLGSSDESRAQFMEGENAIASLETEIHRVQREIELLGIDRRQLEEDRRENAKTGAKTELKVKSLTDGQAALEQARAMHTAELESVRAEIAAKEHELARIIPEYNRRKAMEVEVKQALDTAEATRARLFTKQSRSSQFRNKSERDNFLKREIVDLNTTLSTQKANRMDADEEVKRVEGSIRLLESELSSLRSKLEGWAGDRGSLADEVTKAKDTLDKLNDERKQLRREDDKLESVILNVRQERDQAERDVAHATDGGTARGLATIRRLKQEKDIPGAYGTLAELLEVTDAYKLPVEQIAGNSLFHYVVDDAETATYLANTLYKQHGGRVTFMPLSQLRPRPLNLPRTSDAIPLLSKIKYDVKYEKAFQQVFGKTVVCPNLTVAAQYARSHGVDGITPDGDTTNKRGAMTGGYIDPRKSRLDAVKGVKKWRQEYESLVSQSRDIRKQIERKDQEITVAMGVLQKLEQKLRQVDDGFEPLRHEVRAKTAHLENQRSHLESSAKRRDAVEKNMKDFSESLAAHEAELASDFKKVLTPAEERQLDELSRGVQDLHKQWNELSQKRRELEHHKQILEVDLFGNLQLKLDQLNSQAFENSASSGASGSLKEAHRELKRVRTTAANIEARLQQTEQSLDTQQSHILTLEKEKAELELTQLDIANKIERQQKKIEKSLQRKALLSTQATECAKNIRDLGVLPEEAFGKYENMEAKVVSYIISMKNMIGRLKFYTCRSQPDSRRLMRRSRSISMSTRRRSSNITASQTSKTSFLNVGKN
jgi:structural maintenance of chromosome 3 (chondroitin sulfate proteoglycan 6)